MLRGEIWVVALPMTGGREQAGQRPAVVLQDASYGHLSPLVIVVPLTSQQGVLRFPGTVRLDPSPANGLTVVSIAMVFQMRALDRSRFVRRAGDLDTADLERVIAELDHLTGRS